MEARIKAHSTSHVAFLGTAVLLKTMQKRPFRDAENHSERPIFTTRADLEELLDKTCSWMQQDSNAMLGIDWEFW